MAKIDVCAPVAKKIEEEPKPPCPTRIPEPNYIEPPWYTTKEPNLNKKTSE